MLYEFLCGRHPYYHDLELNKVKNMIKFVETLILKTNANNLFADFPEIDIKFQDLISKMLKI